MKAMILSMIFCLGLISSSFSQEKNEQPDKVIAYKAQVKIMDGEILKGILFYADSENIFITDGYKSRKKELIRVPYLDIRTIDLHREGSRLKGTIVGSAIGVGLALLITKDVKDQPAGFLVKGRSRENIIISKVFSMATIGGVVGAQLSDKRAGFTFLGNKYAYLNQLNKLKEYCFVQEMNEIPPEE